jgi:hypothetical protein
MAGPTITDNISIRLTHEIDEAGEYNAFRSIDVDIMLHQEKIGCISAVLVNRVRQSQMGIFTALWTNIVEKFSGSP